MNNMLLGTKSVVASNLLYAGLFVTQIINCVSSSQPHNKVKGDSGNLSESFASDWVKTALSNGTLNATRDFKQSDPGTEQFLCDETNSNISENISKENNLKEVDVKDNTLVISDEHDFSDGYRNNSTGIPRNKGILPITTESEKGKIDKKLNLSLHSKSSVVSQTLQELSGENIKKITKDVGDLQRVQEFTTQKFDEFLKTENPALRAHSFGAVEDSEAMSSLFESISPPDDRRESNSSKLGRKVSSLLDSLLLGYDKRLRPNFGRTPLTVKADMEIRSMGPISEKDMIFSMDCYFRQNWVDRRLAFNATEEQVTKVSLNLKMLERIWHPDTYFINGGPSYVHTITTPNKFIRLFYDGSVLFSQRLTIKANCPMHLEKFPMDSQLCPLHIASFGYPASDVIYEWHYGNALAAVAATDMRLSQFDLKGMPASNSTRSFKGSPHSILTVFFDFRRHTGFFLIQVYLPCCLLVILSWVSFWINREATSDRISLGATTMLTMTFLVLDSRNDLPRVAYSTALDVYVALCFFFVFASIVQFAAVHFFTKYGTADNDFKASIIPDTDSDTDSGDASCDQGCFKSNNQTNFRQPINSHMNLKPDSLTACIRKMWSCLLSTRTKRFNKNVRNSLGLNSVSKIDTMSRVLFPLAFLGLNIVYWILYW